MSVRDGRVDEDRAFLQRSLADLDVEHDAGDLSDRDWRELRASYAARLAALDAPVVAAGEVTPGAPADDRSGGRPAAGAEPRLRRRRKLVAAVAAAVVVAAGLGGLALRSSGSRLPSGVATGSAVGAERTAQLLAAGAAASAKGDGVAAIKDYAAVLATDPNQPVALTQEGWILAQTQQPNLLRQGIGLLDRAVQTSPDYPPARVYRGVAYLSEADFADAAGDLQWYLGHDPDPSLVTKVQAALADARAGLARQQAPTPTSAPPTSAAGAGGPVGG
ncbi:MAG TPA: hypothetical protein VFP61_07495 [Acidimicrobiales bacterium]|nr:hypothetical protein [Acidimicrobiales bacterium]